jgi:plastocyanin
MPVRKLMIACLITVTVLLAACGDSSTSTGGAAPTATVPAPTATTPANAAATVAMSDIAFVSAPTITIKAGQGVFFNNPQQGGGVHTLVTGKNGGYEAQPGAPAPFASSTGITFTPGDSRVVVFPKAGTYSITCEIHPDMLVTITVTK